MLVAVGSVASLHCGWPRREAGVVGGKVAMEKESGTLTWA